MGLGHLVGHLEVLVRHHLCTHDGLVDGLFDLGRLGRVTAQLDDERELGPEAGLEVLGRPDAAERPGLHDGDALAQHLTAKEFEQTCVV